MRYFITGAAGFIGFHLARRLLEEGHTVVGFDGMTSYYDVALKEARLAALNQFPSFRFHRAMLEDHASLRKAMEEAEPDVVVHLAAQAGIRYSLEEPRSYVESNIVGTWNLLDAARAVAPRHLLLASTSSVYGANDAIPFRESDHTDEPLNIYAASKKAMEVMAHSYAHLYRLPTTAFRFFTVYGSWGRPDMALFKFTKAILEGREIEIYGEGRMSRDFTFVGDLVEGILRLSSVVPSEDNRVASPAGLDTLSHQAPYRVVNIGGGSPAGLLEFVATLEEALGQPAKRKLLPIQQGEAPRTYASPDLLLALTGYKPATPLSAGVKDFVDWYRDHYGVTAAR
ncbi:NAD-dependent epimerase/dehydratase family protein [Mycoplana dimorpha]|uniref:UDP-glucuronate 4-epimerase n=1 Tax=Mycoplana dimorpha TaxID=28320 RepID=A0A2T5BID5_MYCDI|nr:NAD-dependent epimerase/dehydratase family protein [Mycoplana dimorpha]PTM98653.1 UDP-glucuronate 4-epimerase [Mycoplana dimorpha]